MEREIYIVRAGAVIWSRRVKPPVNGGAASSAQDYFQEAWRQALEAGAVQEAEAASVQFRSAPPAGA